MRQTLTTLMLAAGLTMGAARLAVAEPPPANADAKQTADEAKKKADEAVKKAIEEAVAKAAKTGQPAAAPPTPGPMAAPVPDGPVLKTISLEDGLVAEEIKIGDGYEVKAGGAVVAHYHGTLKTGGKMADGTVKEAGSVFDSSFTRGTPAMFPLNQVIQGWQKGVPGMKIGGVRRLIVPAKLAYAEREMGKDIPANADLVFVIQLVDALQTTDVKVGEGETVGPQPFVCVTAYSMKDSSGKEIEAATKDNPHIWIPNEMMGVNMGLEGMKVGGRRTIKIPAQMNQSNPQLAGTRPQQIPLTVEIELIALRNLSPKAPK
jgi:FKBP-type peptidyl-prolyl cis-trans isomerase